jgi:MarR family transcriptional regulator, 2-MHQ and catechol-resistance regulon repressor
MPRIEDELVMRFQDERQKALLNVLFTANWFRNIDTARLAPYGLSPQQFNILRILRGAKPGRMSMNEVKGRMLDRAPNATRLSDKLIAKGLILRERCDEDRRVVYMRISEKGLELLARIDGEAEAAITRLAEKLSESEARALNTALDKLRG